MLWAPQIKVAQGCDIAQKCLVTKRHVMSDIVRDQYQRALSGKAVEERRRHVGKGRFPEK